MRIKKLNLFDKIVLAVSLLNTMFLLTGAAAKYISPADFWIPAFAGLIYPFVLLFQVILFLSWLLRKQLLFALVSVLFILATFPTLQTIITCCNFSQEIEEGTAPFKVMSYNVRLFDLYNWTGNAQTRDEIIDFLNKEKPDIICFQEFYYRTDAWFPTRDTLMKVLNMNHIHEGYTHEIHGEQFFGLMIMSRYPIVSNGIIPFYNDANNLCIYSDIVINQDTVRVFNVHLKSIRFQRSDYEALGDETGSEHYKMHPREEQKIIQRLKSAFIDRAGQSELIVKQINASQYPVILGGDFNDTPASYAYHQIASVLSDAHLESGSGMGSTYTGQIPGLRIDYLFHNQNIHSFDFETHSEALSDHYAISCKMQVIK